MSPIFMPVDTAFAQKTAKSLKATALDAEALIENLNSLQAKLREIQEHAINEFELVSVEGIEKPGQLTIQLRANLKVLSEICEAKRDIFSGPPRTTFERVIQGLKEAADGIAILDATYNGLVEED